jgi:phosphomevalonate kinase
VTVAARAPGKLVVLGEYAVLTGADALVMAVDRYARATLRPSPDALCRLVTVTGRLEERRFPATEPSGVALVDALRGQDAGRGAAAWQGRLDTGALYAGGQKLGLGSSAAATVAWAGAWAALTGRAPATLVELIELHRAAQGGLGSGLDVAASLNGGVIAFNRPPGGPPSVVSVALPDSVGFVVVSSGKAAATRDFLERFAAWRAAEPHASDARLADLRAIAAMGVVAAQANDAGRFLDAVAEFGEGLFALGEAIQRDIMTGAHRAIARAAARHGVTYKVSGAGGGDVGLGFATDPTALEAFAKALPMGCEPLGLAIDHGGLVVEEGVASE